MNRLQGLLTVLTLSLFIGCSEDPVVSSSSPITVNLESNISSPKSGEKFILTAKTDAKDPTFEWKEGGSADDNSGWYGGDSNRKEITKNTGGEYTFHVRATSGTKTATDTKKITVVQALTVNLTTDKASYKIGETITLTASTTAPSPTYQWKESTDASWGTSANTATKTYMKNSVGTYTFHVRMASGSSFAEKSVAILVSSGTEWDGSGAILHTDITASTFWVGEGGSGDNGNITNVVSSWDNHWGENFGLVDAPTIPRDANFIPTSPAFKKIENPFYFALPYNDYDDVIYDGENAIESVKSSSSSFFLFFDNDLNRNVVKTKEMSGDRKSSTSQIFWKNDEKSWYLKSMVKARWIKISRTDPKTKITKTCYAQWGDAGPYYYDDASYVFGSARPRNNTDDPKAGIDLSPSVMKYFDIELWKDVGATASGFSWQFVPASAVPEGPWKKYISTNKTNW